MPIDSKSVYYQERIYDWEMIETILEGERAVKDAGETYLPKLKGQDTSDYQAYKERGTFLNATAKTVQGLTGAVMRKTPKVNAPAVPKEVLEDLTPDGLSVDELAKTLLSEVLSFGYLGALADFDDNTNRPYISRYKAEDILNIRTEKVGRIDVIVDIILQEVYYEANPKDEFVTDKKTRLRRLQLIDGIYNVSTYIQNDKGEWGTEQEGITPKVRGQFMDFIPFVFFGSVTNHHVPDKPPLLDLAFLNIKHWQVTVDYYHGLHYCALPTPWAAGWPKESKLYVGPGKAWVTENEAAKCGYLEFGGSGLGAVRVAREDLKQEMATMGARLLEGQKAAAEAAETVERRQSGDVATLSSICSSIENGMKKLLEYVSLWITATVGEITVALNRDFVSDRLAPQQITALLQALQSGAISLDTFLWNLQQGEILAPDTTVEEEKMKLALTGNGNFTSTGKGSEEEPEKKPLPKSKSKLNRRKPTEVELEETE